MPVTKIDSKFGILCSEKETTTKIHLRHSLQVRAHSILHNYKGTEVKVTRLCLTLCDPMDKRAKILEWVAFPFSRGSSQPRDPTQVSHIAGGFFTS